MTKRQKTILIAIIVTLVVAANMYLTIKYDAYLGFFHDMPQTIIDLFN